jgi:alpha-ketoglutarate-dependent taurine dioxygenase
MGSKMATDGVPNTTSEYVSADRMPFATAELTARVGTEIRIDVASLLDGSYAKEIRSLLDRRGVLVFPQVNMTDDEQIAFTKTLGVFAMEDGVGSEIFKVSLDPRETKLAASLQASFLWHIDGTTADVPIFASILSAKRLASVGGETEFCSTYAAYDDLSDEDKAIVEDVIVHHSPVANRRSHLPEMSYDHYQRLRQRGADLPLVWKHRNGRKSLVLGATAEYVLGWPPEDSLDLLMRLRDWATRPQFVYHHKWSVGDIVIWDNTGTMHRALPYDADSGRLMHRTRLAGEETFRNA